MPATILAEAEAAYGSIARADLADACASWLIRGDALVQRAERESTDQLARLRGEDWGWGTATARERLLHRLDVVATIGKDGNLAGFAYFCRAMGVRIRQLWPTLSPLPTTKGNPLDCWQHTPKA